VRERERDRQGERERESSVKLVSALYGSTSPISDFVEVQEK